MLRTLGALGAVLLLAGCGGGSGAPANTAPAPPPPAPALTNFATILVDNGPAVVDTGPNAYVDSDTLFVSVTLCAPGSTTNCQTIDHMQVDTGSVGVRVFQSVLNLSLPLQTDPGGAAVGECYGFVDGYAFGAVRNADVKIGGETASGMAIQVIADIDFNGIPSSCSSGGGSNLNTVSALGANGIVGIGVTSTDCGAACTTAGGSGAALYYDCPAGRCSAIIARAANTSAPFQQVANPIVAFPVDNNGAIISLPEVPAAGAPTLTGTMYFGIGTQTNNALGSATVLTTTTSATPEGAGFLTAVYNNQALARTFLDTGSNAYYFVDPAITPCAGQTFLGYYCPGSPLALSPTLEGQNGTTVSAAFTLYNAMTLFSTPNAALPGLGANPEQLNNLSPFPSSFDFGLPFFFGRNVYVAIEGYNAGGTSGPYFAY